MIKKFVPVTSNASPSKNPYEIRTYISEQCPSSDWKVDACNINTCRCVGDPEKSTIAKVMSIEEQLKRLEERTKEIRHKRPLKRWCTRGDFYEMCVNTQRTPFELREHAIARENYLRVKEEMAQQVIDGRLSYDNKKLFTVQLQSPVILSEGEEAAEEDMESGVGEEKEKVSVQLASPRCSSDHIFQPTQRMLDLKRPRSGYFHNETEPPCFEEDGIDYGTYNPRMAQEELHQQNLKRYDIIEGKTPLDLWTWKAGYQENYSELDRIEHSAKVGPFDCDSMELTVYQIPNDLEKTFRGSLVLGSTAILPAVAPRKKYYVYFNRPPEIAAIYAAFVERFRSLPDYWNMEILDAILAQGDKLLKKSAFLNFKSSDMDFDIIPQIQEYQAVVGLKLHFSGPMRNEPNIYKALTLYFSKYDAAILCSSDLFLLIWKRCSNSFFVFDPNGRDSGGVRDFQNGKCSLTTLSYIEHLVHLIVNFSNLDLSQEYNLYEIFLVNFGKITNPLPLKPFPKPFHRLWITVNKYYALIPGFNSGLHPPISPKESNTSIAIALLAFLYSHVERAKNWRPDTIDDLCKYGQDYYKRLAKKLKMKAKQQLNIVDLPDTIMMVAYKATYHKRPFLYNGNIANCRNFLDSQLTLALRELLTSKYDGALLQIDNFFLAIFRDKELFYVFDPFRRGRVGQVLDPEDYMTKGVACLQMHSNIESLCRNLYSKALLLSNEGKFFLHGLKINCIKPLVAALGLKNNYPALHLAYPKVAEKISESPQTDGDDKSVKSVKSTKSAAGKPKKKKGRSASITSLPYEERLPEYTDEEVVEGLLDEIICQIISEFPEPILHRPGIYKQAQAVLLRSDKAYLEHLRHGVLHNEDPDNIYAVPETHGEPQDKPPTLEEELKAPSNFLRLPDGSWVLFGKMQMPALEEDSSKLGGILSALLTAVLSAKYKISTWNADLIGFALENVSPFGDHYNTYEHALNALLEGAAPRVTVGGVSYKVEVEQIAHSTVTMSLQQILLSSLKTFSRILVVCQRFSCLVVRRYNFLYMFIGFPCSPVGYRKFGDGPACMLRFMELDGLVRRIEYGCNPLGGQITNYVLIPLRIVEEPWEQFKKMLRPDEAALYRYEKDKLLRSETDKREKLRFLDDELQKEQRRQEKFLALKNDAEARREERRLRHFKKAKSKFSGALSEEEETGLEEFGDEYETLEEGEEEAEEELKHKPGKRLRREATDEVMPRVLVSGYRMRNRDCRYKIQGCLYLEGRNAASKDSIKGCFFASALAIIYASLRPLNEWRSIRVDRVINGAKSVLSKNPNMEPAQERIMKNVDIDDYTLDLRVKSFAPLGLKGLPIQKKLKRMLKSRDYLMLQTANCTYAIYHDRFYHLFDAYRTLETAIEDEELGEEEAGKKDEKGKKQQRKCPRGFRKFEEKNAASWVLFADVKEMVKYINARTTNRKWNKVGEYEFYVIDILSYKKAPQKQRLLQMLTELADSPTQAGDYDETAVCAKSERVDWLEVENCLPAWSRLNRRNTAAEYRNTPLTKAKKYDIEISNRLWSLWGSLHPCAPVFSPESRGKQFLACNVVSLLAAKLYLLSDWSPQLLDHIVINGDRYHRESLANIRRRDYEFSIEDLKTECTLENIKFTLHIEHVCFGRLYSRPTRTRMNLADSLMYFFHSFQFGILQCEKKSLAFGRSIEKLGGYFMFDCMSYGHPLFPKGQGAAYVLRTKHLQVLLYCMVVTLNMTQNVEFTIHKVEMLREGANVETTGEEVAREDDG